MDSATGNSFQDVPAASQSAAPRCAVHPNATATFCCSDCGKHFCDTCAFKEDDGKTFCTDCMIRRTPRPLTVPADSIIPPVDPDLERKMLERSDKDLIAMLPSTTQLARKLCSKCGVISEVSPGKVACGNCGAELPGESIPDESADWAPETISAARAELHRRNLRLAPPIISNSPPPPPKFEIREGVMCVQHPHIKAVQQCKQCGAFMCQTCDFSFANDIHLCPACATATDHRLSSRRKKFLIGSFALAAWTTLGMVCVVGGAFRGIANSPQDTVALGWVLLIFVLAPAIAGLTLALNARSPRMGNPPSLWLAVAWNAIMIASFVILDLIGMSRK